MWISGSIESVWIHWLSEMAVVRDWLIGVCCVGGAEQICIMEVIIVAVPKVPT